MKKNDAVGEGGGGGREKEREDEDEVETGAVFSLYRGYHVLYVR